MPTKQRTRSSDSRLRSELTNRTGLSASSHAPAMLENAEIPVEGSPAQFLAFRSSLMNAAPPLGSMPRPATLTAATKQALSAVSGGKLNVLLDKLAERLAFERSGARLYETLLLKHEAAGTVAGGPTREELLRFRDEETSHFKLLERALTELDADPTAVTPSADMTGVASLGVAQLICDPRTSLGECLEAILIAELVDHDAWERLIELAEDLGHDELADQFRDCERQEQVHLESVRRWVTAHLQELAGAQ
jgi:rubrerythrin